MIMQDWPQPGAGRAADTERDPAGTIPDPPDRADPADRSDPPAAAEDDSAEWDELTPAGTGHVTPPADVLVAGRPVGTPPPPGGPPYAGRPAERPVTPSTEPAAAAATPAAEAAAAPEPAHGGGETVIESGTADGFHARWRDVQFGFVDDPRAAVRQADELADKVVRSFTDALDAHKRALEDRWRSQRDAPPDTERLRLIVRAYREFVDRLLTT
jgi:hypothetical protein